MALRGPHPRGPAPTVRTCRQALHEGHTPAPCPSGCLGIPAPPLVHPHTPAVIWKSRPGRQRNSVVCFPRRRSRPARLCLERGGKNSSVSKGENVLSRCLSSSIPSACLSLWPWAEEKQPCSSGLNNTHRPNGEGEGGRPEAGLSVLGNRGPCKAPHGAWWLSLWPHPAQLWLGG